VSSHKEAIRILNRLNEMTEIIDTTTITIKNALDSEFKDFEDAMRDRTVPHTVIAQALKSLGIEVSDNTIRRWRNKQ
jgi:hypothetical protein